MIQIKLQYLPDDSKIFCIKKYQDKEYLYYIDIQKRQAVKNDINYKP